METLRRAGLDPLVVVSGVDEDALAADSPTDLVLLLARAKGRAVADVLVDPGDRIIIACDSVLEFDGVVHGKPASADVARDRWQRMRGRVGQLHTGHHLILRRGGTVSEAGAVATTEVRFAALTDEEIEAYLATGEPEQVAGAFTIDGIGGAFIESIGGDPHNVVGISLPLLRRMLAEHGIAWHTLWRAR